MKWIKNPPTPLIVSGRSIFQSGSYLKVCVTLDQEYEIDLKLNEDNIVDAILGYLEVQSWDVVGGLFGKSIQRLLGGSGYTFIDKSKVFEEYLLPRIRNYLSEEESTKSKTE